MPTVLLLAPAACCVWLVQMLTLSAVPSATPSAGPATAAVPDLAAQPLPGPAPASASAVPVQPMGGQPQVSPGWVADVATDTGMPAAAVTAYADAVLREPSGCGLSWTTLAGIGWVESEQGSVGGRTLLPDGRPSTAILGPALDGRGFAAIAAPPGSSAAPAGASVGAARWAHAVGPLQFLPSTWRIWGRDGDGDGVADPQDLDDAASAAAAYLCATGQDLSTGAGWSAAVFAYNHSQAYVRQVFAAASTYAERAG